MSYPKVIFGPFSVFNAGKGRVLRVELHTNGDWRGTTEGEQELDRVASVLVKATDKFPEGSKVLYENNNWMYLNIPCAENEVYRWIIESKKMIPELTGAVLNSKELSPDR